MRNPGRILLVCLGASIGVLLWWSMRQKVDSTDIAAIGSVAPETPALQVARSERIVAPEMAERSAIEPAIAPSPPAPVSEVRTTILARAVVLGTADPIDGIGLQVSKPYRARKDTRPKATFPKSAVVRTDAQGRASFDVEPGKPLAVFLVQPEWPEQELAWDVPPLASGEQREVLLELRTQYENTFWGRIVDAESHLPLSGATVQVTRSGGAGIPGNVHTTHETRPSAAEVDEDGRFKITWPSEVDDAPFTRLKNNGVCEVCVHKSGFGLKLAELEAGHESAERALQIELDRSASVEFSLGCPDRDRLKGLRARLSSFTQAMHQDLGREGLHGYLELEWTAPIEIDGKARIDGLPPRAMLIAELVEGEKRTKISVAPLVLKPGELRSVAYSLAPGARLAGRLVDQEDHGVASIPIWIIPAVRADIGRDMFPEHGKPLDVSQTDATGSFSFPDVPSGPCFVGPAPVSVQRKAWNDADGVFNPVTPYAEIVQIEPGAPLVEVRVSTWRGFAIHGHVEDPSGKPLPGVSLTLTSSEVRSYDDAGTDKQGHFVFLALADCDYQLDARTIMKGISPSDEMTVHPGKDEITVRMNVGGDLAGGFVGADGQPVKAMEIVLIGPGPDSKTYHPMIGLPRADFSYVGLAPGSYALIARGAEGLVGFRPDIQVRAGATNQSLVVELTPGGRLVVMARPEFKGRAHYHVYTADWLTTHLTQVLSPGSRDVYVLPPGRAVVRFDAFNGVEPIAFEALVRTGEEAEVAWPRD